jgi:hypothetical protein
MKFFNQNALVCASFTALFFGIISCKEQASPPGPTARINEELEQINMYLRDPEYAAFMAKRLDSAYYAGVGQPQPTFLSPSDDTAIVYKTMKSEKIATNLAGFYALECGVGLLNFQSNTTPVEWLEKIKNKTIDSGAKLLLNRFANATWKAGQPFRDLDRITRPNFIVASSLSREEVEKDYVQISNAADKLLSSMDSVRQAPVERQMELLRRLLQDTSYAVEMAAYLHSAYYRTTGQKEEPFLTSKDDTARVQKTARQVKIATSMAGFYALECGLNYLATTRDQSPSRILRALGSDSLSKEDNMLFARFANATWKAGQPFRDMNRITRATFTPFYFLSEPDIDKDLVQVKAAAKILLEDLEK